MASIDPSSTEPLLTSTHVNIQPTTDSSLPTLNVGTRKSLLARVQTDLVVAALQKAHPDALDCKIHAISTMGDKNQVTALHAFDAKSLWTFELEDMLAKGEVDLIVHSLKDIPTQMDPKYTLGAIMEREDPRDALVLHPKLPKTTTLSDLPENATVGTSSVRRSAQLKRLYPHLRFQSVRGNVGTRLRKLDDSDLALSTSLEGSSGSKKGNAETVAEPARAEGEEYSGPVVHYSALILAAAGLKRLDLGHRISHLFESKNVEATKDGQSQKGMFHAVGQGALGIQSRAGDQRVAALLKPLNHLPTRYACLAERSLMRTLEGGCSVPIGVETEWATSESASPDVKDELLMRAIVVALDGEHAVECEVKKIVKDEKAADELGWEVAGKLVELGAKQILQGITLNRGIIEGEKQDGA